ncbi:MAG: Ig-like domain-containing protein [Sediminibacterium sp.]
MFILVTGCRDVQKDIVVRWENGKAKAIQIPLNWVAHISKDTVEKQLTISLLNNKTAILGDYKIGTTIVFEPLIPFSAGTDYVVWVLDKKMGQFTIPAADGSNAPQIISSYPQQDTVPENLLKIYIQFSKPMREGQSAKYLTLLKNGKDTLHDVFLDLQPELWNEDRTVFTTWLDPGRIKRDLQPNLKLGAPLQSFGKYELIILKEWKDAQGIALQKNYSWSFTTRERDSLSPDPGKWKMHTPTNLSKESLVIELDEPMDHFLLMESLHITGKNGEAIKGIFEVSDKDKKVSFSPAEPWSAGNYTLFINAKLEDLSGNNINRPFERDMIKTKETVSKNYFSKSFYIEK